MEAVTVARFGGPVRSGVALRFGGLEGGLGGVVVTTNPQ
jgi:hypothetical protein